MVRRRVTPALCVSNNNIYAIGGVNYQSKIKNVCQSMEMYDPKTNTWKEITEFIIQNNEMC